MAKHHNEVSQFLNAIGIPATTPPAAAPNGVPATGAKPANGLTTNGKSVSDQMAKAGVDEVKKLGKTIGISAALFAAGGLGFAHYRKSGVGGYIGFFFLGTVVGSMIGATIASHQLKNDLGLNNPNKGATPSIPSTPSTSASAKPMDGETFFNSMTVAMKKIDPTAQIPDAKGKQAMIAAYNGLTDMEKNAFVDTTNQMMDCMAGGKDSKDPMAAFGCIAQKGEDLTKKYPKEVLESMGKKMDAAGAQSKLN